jgi:hypothetical protein
MKSLKIGTLYGVLLLASALAGATDASPPVEEAPRASAPPPVPQTGPTLAGFVKAMAGRNVAESQRNVFDKTLRAFPIDRSFDLVWLSKRVPFAFTASGEIEAFMDTINAVHKYCELNGGQLSRLQEPDEGLESSIIINPELRGSPSQQKAMRVIGRKLLGRYTCVDKGEGYGYDAWYGSFSHYLIRVFPLPMLTALDDKRKREHEAWAAQDREKQARVKQQRDEYERHNRELPATIKPGDQVGYELEVGRKCAMVVEVKPPLAYIQIGGKQLWARIDQLSYVKMTASQWVRSAQRSYGIVEALCDDKE